MIEVRDYHYDPTRMAEYRDWAQEAGVFLRDRWRVDGFWVDGGAEPLVMGSDPQVPIGPANVTWVIRWDDRAQRDAAWDALWDDPVWTEIWDRHPGFDGYRQLLVRFLEQA